METAELIKMMEAYDSKLDKALKMDSLYVERLTLKRPANRANRLLFYRMSEVLVFSVAVLFFGWFVAKHWGNTPLVISGIVVHLFAIIALVGSIGQVALLQQVDFAKPIVEIKKKIERVNAHQLLFVKLLLLSVPVWWAYALVALKLLIGVDLYTHLEYDFVIRYLILNFLLIVPVLWFLNKLSHQNMHINWVRKTIAFLVGRKTNEALLELKELERFERN
ncbi:hypothetical protein LVD15_14230 [Fulvivirga maritima]|uniref:hypothetical protein n=1 Tax=Fulvivirga maritima TaxID=2904247 RepID=UPI001F369520|nr:hypothetical protein [Fulvivirga maritima]UII24480.1 hypothetical protein LVD15_14230 [Fulvivirga maritima]